jgi:exosortase
MAQTTTRIGRPGRNRATVVLAVALLASLLWASWPTLGAMAQRWSTDPRYAHGYLVPVFAVALLWLRRDRLAGLELRPSWWGLPLLAAGGALHLAGLYFYVDWFTAVSLLPSLAGACVLLGGWRCLGWSAPAIAFLIFMLPLPFRLEVALGYPLQRLATLASTYAMQTIGLPALAEGNIVHLDDVEIGVVEACSGLSMLLTFFALSTGVALVIRRPLLDRILIVASAVPIALIVNIARITVTGVLHQTVGSRLANLVFHDLAGWLMMPMALGLLWAELGLLAHLLVEPDPAAAPRPLDPAGATADRRGPRGSGQARRRATARDEAMKRLLNDPRAAGPAAE